MSGDKYCQAIHTLYTRQDFDECMKLVEQVIAETNGACEYAIFVKAMIKRHRGQVQQSLELFQQATALNPHNLSNLKQVARSLYLLGKHKAAIDVYEEAERLDGRDWEIWHNKGLCHMYLKNNPKAIECFHQANEIQPHDATYMQLGKVYTLQDDFSAAVATYMEALEHSPENTDVLTTLGLLFLRMGDNTKAFEFLGSSMTHDPRNPRTILAAGSIIQDHQDMDVALVKYRIAAILTPNSPQLWNNIGMCFFGKQKYIAAIACLKKALYLGPFEWIINYNLGLVHLHTNQPASAFHYFSASINLKPDFAHSYMYLAVTLAKLHDFGNSSAAYEKAIEMANEPVFHLNYAISLHAQGHMEAARQHFQEFKMLFEQLDEGAKNADPEVVEQRHVLSNLLQM